MARERSNDWQKALDDLLESKAEKVPEGWITALQFAALKKPPIHRTAAREQLNSLVAAGKAERDKFRISTENRVQLIYHYRLKK